MWLEPLTLTGAQVRLEPLAPSHVPDLARAGSDPAIWTYLPHRPSTEADFAVLVQRSLDLTATGSGVGFAQRVVSDGSLAGATGFWNAEPTHRRVEIGYTWLSPRWQRTALNTEAKYLLLRHAFETLGCVRVEFKTDSRNARSRAALLRLGAIEEGTLRNHMIMPDGVYRHSTYYSIIESEWPALRARLEQRLRPPKT